MTDDTTARTTAHSITINFDSADSVNHRVHAENVHPSQFFVAAKVCESLGLEYFARQRMTEIEQQSKNALTVARSIIERPS